MVINHSGSGVTIASPIAVDNNLNLTAGIVTSTAVNKITMNSGTSVSNASDASYIDGYIEKIGTTDFTFPVGDDGNYQPISVTSITGGGTDAFTANYTEQNAHGAGYDTMEVTGLHHVGTCEYWILNQSVNTPTATVTVAYDANSCGVTDTDELEIARWNGSTWVKHDATVSGDLNSGTITTNAAVTTFSPFTLASNTNANPLPIELHSFSAKPADEKVLIEWKTLIEINNDFFTVERSKDGVNFNPIEEVKGAGYSSALINYSTVDYNPFKGVSYYRLVQTDYDGSQEVFEPQMVYIEDDNTIFNIYPNPVSVNGVLTLHQLESSNITSNIALIDMSGKKVFSSVLNKAQGDMQLNLSELRLSPGIYTLNINTAIYSSNHRIVVQ